MAFERKLVIPIIGDSRSFERAIKRSINASHRFDSRMGRMGKMAAFGLAGAASAAGGLGIALGISAVKEASKFEQAMSRIRGLAGQSQKQVETWGNQLLSLGPKLGKSPQELAEALYFIASSGIPASKAISALTASAKASAAGLGETEVVADAVTSVMNAYAASGMTAGHATDVLVATVREGKGEADQFAGVIGNVAAFASRLKVPFEQVGAALATMTQLGTDPRTAATQLMAFFSSVLKVSGPMQKRADKIGFSFEQLTKKLASGDLRGALRYIKEFAESHGGVTALAPMFPNVRALRALLALTPSGSGGQKVLGVFNRMKKSTGSLKAAFTAAEKTSAQSFAKMGASLHTLKIVIGQELLPVVKKFVNWLTKKLSDPKNIVRIRKAFEGFGAWFSQNWPAIKQGFQTAWNILKGITRVVKALAPLMVTITKPLRLQLKILMAIWDKVLGAISFGAGLLSHLPGIGGKFAGIQVAVDTARAALHPLRGDGKGDVHVHGPVILYDTPNPKKMAEDLYRHGRRHASRTRGSHQTPLLGHK